MYGEIHAPCVAFSISTNVKTTAELSGVGSKNSVSESLPKEMGVSTVGFLLLIVVCLLQVAA